MCKHLPVGSKTTTHAVFTFSKWINTVCSKEMHSNFVKNLNISVMCMISGCLKYINIRLNVAENVCLWVHSFSNLAILGKPI